MFGKKIYAYETVTSTQDIAREKALAGEPAGTVIAAAFQTGGRGRRGRGWFAPRSANVCMTVIGPPVALMEAWQIALVAGVAVAEGICDAAAVTPTLRFPNDIWCDGAKLGGILVETVPHPKAGYIIPIIGIGVNVNIPADVFPADLRDKSTSLLRVTGAEQRVGTVQGQILLRLGVQWDLYEKGLLDSAILPHWHALADPEARRNFVIDGQQVACHVLHIAADGTIRLACQDGNEHRLHASQVIFGDD